MPLQSSGAISISDINTELALSSNANSSLNDARLRGLARIASGSISLNNFYGKSRIYSAPNLISDPSVENGTNWSFSGTSRSTTNARFGSWSIFFPNRSGSGLNMTTQSMPTPLANNKYFGGRWLNTLGATVTCADLRFEWFLGDAFNRQLVFGANQGTFSQYTLQSSIQEIPAPVAGSWIIRHFTVNQTGGNLYTDGHFIVNLTATFGAGNEPDVNWCNTYYDFPNNRFIV
jgi:hypothetical protein